MSSHASPTMQFYAQEMCQQRQTDDKQPFVRDVEFVCSFLRLVKSDLIDFDNQRGERISNHQVDFAISSTSSKEVIEKEYLVYDLTSMVGTLGGSLGLFLGFSFFDFVSTIIDYFPYFAERAL